ncbi:MAG: ATP-dependent RNA helicase HrpA [Thermodesulfobacteriota bacterium]
MDLQINYPEELPISAARREIIEAIRDNQVVIIAGDTGSGKSTQLPKMCLEAGRGQSKMIGCTQPRRLAATSVASRVAEELGPAAVNLVGCKIRFADRTSSATRIKFMTDGILLAETRRDNHLNGYDTIIVDEAHERSLNIDFLLGILRRLISRRRDLKLIITSATIDTGKFAKAFNDAPVIKVSGRTYPVELRYLPSDEEEEASYVEQAVAAVVALHKEGGSGDILVFMPTERDIRETVDGLEKAIANGEGIKGGATVLPLFGRLSGGDQNRIFRPARGRKIVVATNVAETSITVPGIRYVVDTGMARISIYNPRARTSKLPIRKISRASADQRQGRCGRTGPGICLRLYSEDDYLNREEFTRPEIQRADLADVILRMLFLHLGEPGSFPFIDPPAPRAVKDGYNLLWELGAIKMKDGNRASARLTGRGKIMAHLPLDPRITRMIIEARDRNAVAEVTVIAAALSIADPRVRPADREKEADQAHGKFGGGGSDFLSFLNIWTECAKLPSQGRLRKFCKQNFLSFMRIREWRDIHEQIRSILDSQKGFKFHGFSAKTENIHKSILSGNLRNLGLCKAKNIYQGAQDKEVMIFPGSVLFNKAGKWVMAAELVETSRLFARCVANIKVEWIEPLASHLCKYSWVEPHWEKKRGQVVAFENVSLFGLLIEARRRINFGPHQPDEAREIFIQQALVEADLGGNFPFLSQNMAMIERLQELEDRVRQRDIMVDDWTINRFYEERLPKDVYDRTSLVRFIKKNGSDDFLRMVEDDIVSQEPDSGQLAEFPDELDVGGFSCKATYRFQPGTEDDGISVHIPVDVISQVEPIRFDWLVPGMLLEKIIFLLKGLPKSLRRQLIPVPDTARTIFNELQFGHGSFYGTLQDLVMARKQVRIERHDWPLDSLSDHLKVRFCLIDGHGKILKASRNFADLAVPAPNRPTGDLLAVLQKKWERQKIADWDFADLPERIPVKDRQGRLLGFAWPGLEDGGKDGVSLRLFASREDSVAATRYGLLALYLTKFQKLKNLKKDFTLGTENWALYEGIGSKDEVNRDLLAFILTEVFSCRAGVIPDREAFANQIDMVRKEGLFVLGRKLLNQVTLVLRERRAVLDQINRYEGIATPGERKKQFDDFRRHLDTVIPVNFLRVFDTRRLRNCQRYLKALLVRIERAHADPSRDALRAEQILIHEERLLTAGEHQTFAKNYELVLGEYREMIDEFRISVFAQELKTAFPISAKRLDKKWRKLTGLG